ncbi:Globin-coupled histidine kinase [Salmonella enterica subsp. enterica]|nr:Globin-coupled histidine kinase [Salmonella enterica subsp. enterica serovar Mikawasima]EJQ8143227.1 hypothetical protein [Salmonella enterica]MIO72856.1 Globin-coupled histidine kinase [Salmonella enterica subsp. enterica serovar Mikawasima]
MKEMMCWNIKEEQIVDDLLAFLCITPDECILLSSMQADARKLTAKMVDEYYARLINYPMTNEFITDIELLKKTLSDWFISLFCGVYDQNYARERLRIGMAHVRIGLPVRYPLAMFDILQKYGVETAYSKGPQGINAFLKILSLDIATFSQAYDNTQLSHLTKLVGGSTKLARRLLQDQY